MSARFSCNRVLLIVAALLALALAAPRCNGDVGVVLNDSLDTSIARITGSGHSAVYLSRICPDSPVRLRLCGPGEQGSVISNYTSLGEDEPFEWNIVPLSVYVYGVEDARNRPLFGSDKIKSVLEASYREKYLAAYCASHSCQTSGKAEWKLMVGASLVRSFYIFIVETTVQQDLDLIAKFNALPNQNHFNGVARNCADFTKDVIDTYFPHSAHRDPLNDFGMTSPKAVARSFTRYALQHPDMRFRVLHFSQLPGTIKRSSAPRSGTEQLFRSKKLLVPTIFFPGYELPAAAAASYELTGRFNPERAFEEYPTTEATEIGYEIQLAKDVKDKALADQLKTERESARARVLGTSDEWKAYREEFDSLADEAVRREVIPDRNYLDGVFKRLDEAGRPLVDERGAAWMEVMDNGKPSKVGISASDLLAPGSDPRLAYELTLARVGRTLKSSKSHRETMLEFKRDWALLQRARTKDEEFAGKNSGAAISGSY